MTFILIFGGSETAFLLRPYDGFITFANRGFQLPLTDNIQTTPALNQI